MSSHCSGDQQPLTGWEFHLSNLSSMQHSSILVNDSYQCVPVIIHFSSTQYTNSRFVWKDNKDLKSWVQSININQMTNIIPCIIPKPTD
jgi:hypothetical protein